MEKQEILDRNDDMHLLLLCYVFCVRTQSSRKSDLLQEQSPNKNIMKLTTNSDADKWYAGHPKS